jgi:hypothetical protein
MRSLSLPILAVLVLVAAACSDSGKSENEAESSLAGALTKGVKFRNGLIKKGALGKADAARVKLSSTLKAMAMKPSGASIMALGVENPDQDENAIAATLMQFAGAEDHIEVPIDDNAGAADGGASEDELEVQNPWECTEDICEHLCNRKFYTHVTIAIRLEDGSISEHRDRDVVLDCTKDGDPKQCTPDGGDDEPDAATSDAAAPGDGAADGGTQDAAVPHGDAGAQADATPSPVLASIDPVSTVAGMELTLSVSGSGFVEAAGVFVDGSPLVTEFVGDDALTAMVPAEFTTQPGSLSVYVENVPGDAHTRSGTLYLQIDPVAGAPQIYDYSPDNGIPGDKILIIASNLAGEDLEIKDADGHALRPGAIGTISWPTAGSADTVEVELPDDIANGPITVSNSKGSFRGKIFSVGRNLTRLDGTEIAFSTEYNMPPTQWSSASGADNQLATSYFTAHGDCASLASCTTKPWFMVTFPSGQAVARIAIRGNREYASGYDFLTAKFELLGADEDVLWHGTYDLPGPDRDLDIVLPKTFDDVFSVRFSSIADESDEPGFSELEVFGP